MLKPQMIHQAAVFHLDKRLDAEEVKKYTATLRQIPGTLRSINARALLFSLEHTETFESKAVAFLIKELQKIQDQLEIPTGFCHYPYAFFKAAIEPSKEAKTGLFKYCDTAFLLLRLNDQLKKRPLVVYDEDETMKQTVAAGLSAHGYNTVTPEDADDFQRYIDNRHQFVLVHETYFDVLEKSIPSIIRRHSVIYKLHDRTDSKIAHYFNLYQHTNRITKGFRLFLFDAKAVNGIDAKAVDFFCSLALTSKKDEAVIAFFGIKTGLITSGVKEKMERSGIIFADTESNIFASEAGKKAIQQTKQIRGVGLNKALISKLPLFITASLETLMALFKNKPAKGSQEISKIDGKQFPDSLHYKIVFDGELDGKVYIIYPPEVTEEIMQRLNSRKGKQPLDASGALELFSKNLAGRIHAKLREEDLISHFEPSGICNDSQVFTTIKRKGALVQLLSNNLPLYLFLTR